MRTSTSRRSLVVLFALLAVAVVVWGPAPPVGAHASVLQVSPGPGQTVGGLVERVEMVFVTDVTDVTVKLSTPDGASVSAPVAEESGAHVVAEFQPLSTEGPYTVEYSWVAPDGFAQSSAFQFTYARDAQEPAVLVPSSGLNPLAVVVPVGLAAIGGLMLVRLLVNRRRSVAHD